MYICTTAKYYICNWIFLGFSRHVLPGHKKTPPLVARSSRCCPWIDPPLHLVAHLAPG